MEEATTSRNYSLRERALCDMVAYMEGMTSRVSRLCERAPVIAIYAGDAPAPRDWHYRAGPQLVVLRPDFGSDGDLLGEIPFAFCSDRLKEMTNPKSLAAFHALGGLTGLQRGLSHNISSGLSVSGQCLNSHPSFDGATSHPLSAAPLQLEGAIQCQRQTTFPLLPYVFRLPLYLLLMWIFSFPLLPTAAATDPSGTLDPYNPPVTAAVAAAVTDPPGALNIHYLPATAAITDLSETLDPYNPPVTAAVTDPSGALNIHYLPATAAITHLFKTFDIHNPPLTAAAIDPSGTLAIHNPPVVLNLSVTVLESSTPNESAPLLESLHPRVIIPHVEILFFAAVLLAVLVILYLTSLPGVRNTLATFMGAFALGWPVVHQDPDSSSLRIWLVYCAWILFTNSYCVHACRHKKLGRVSLVVVLLLAGALLAFMSHVMEMTGIDTLVTFLPPVLSVSIYVVSIRFDICACVEEYKNVVTRLVGDALVALGSWGRIPAPDLESGGPPRG